MKIIKICILMVCLLTLPSALYAAGSCSVKKEATTVYNVQLLTWDCTGDSSDGSIPSATSQPINGWVSMIETVPGSPSPTDNYSLTLSTSDGIDITDGALASRSSSKGQQILISRIISGALTLAATGQSAASAQFKVRVWVYKEK